MRLAVQDANIIIDLIKIDLWQLTLQLELEIYTTDFVVGELGDEQLALIQPHIDNGLFRIRTFEAEEIDQIFALNARIPALAAADCSVLQAATTDGAMLLTGDRRLRNEAGNTGIKVHGILWIFDRLLDSGMMDFSLASTKLRDLMALNTRLPSEECKARLQNWAQAR